MQYFTRAGSLGGIEPLITARGGNIALLLRQVGLSPVILRTPEAHLPYSAVADLYRLAAQTCRTPDFGLQLGARQGLEIFGPLGSALCLQSTVGEALTFMQRSLNFHARGVSLYLAADANEVRLQISFAFADEVDCAQLAATSIALAVTSIGQLQNDRVAPRRIWLATTADVSPPGSVVAGCAVETGMPFHEIAYPVEILQRPLEVAQAIRDRLDEAWQTSISGVENLSLAQRIESAIDALLPTGECVLPVIARMLGRQPRMVQYDLHREGTSFGKLLQQCRQRLAQDRLARSDISITELAYNLSFADVAAFSRAFRSWTGLSPRQWRSENGI